MTSTKICISTEIASLQPTPEYKYILKTIIRGAGGAGRGEVERRGGGETGTKYTDNDYLQCGKRTER